MVRIGHQLTTTTNNHNESSKEAEERTHRRGVPKLCLPWGIRAPTQYSSLGPPNCTSQAESRSVHLFFYGSRSCPTDRHTDHATSQTIGRIFALRLCDAASSSHARTLVRECCKDDDESQLEREKFEPPAPQNPLNRWPPKFV